MSRFLSRSSRLSRQIEIFEIFEGNRDFFEINRDFVEINRYFFSLDRDILDFRHLWKVVFKVLPWLFLAYLGLHSDPPQISTTKINISIEIYQKSSYFSIEKSRKITKVSKNLDLDQKVHSWLSSSSLNRDISISIKISRLSRLTFENRRDQLSFYLGRDF